MKASLVISFILVACGDNASTPAPADAPAEELCTVGPTVERTRFVDESVAYLRSAFGVTAGFDGGDVAYGEGWVSIDDGGCLADWTTLAYVVAIDPAQVPVELRGTHTRVAAMWALNGRRFVAYLPAVDGDAAPWWQGAMPDNSIAVAKANAKPADITRLLAKLAADQPTVRATFLDAIGILTLETTIGNFAFDEVATGRVANIEAATQAVRASGLFDSVEWSGFVVRIPFESFPASVVSGEQLGPECLRTKTLALRDGNMFSTLPAFAPPLGAGPTPNPAACQ